MEERAREWMTGAGALMPLIVSNALSALGAIVILLVGLWLSGRADALAVGMLGRTPQLDPMLKGFFGSLIRYLILIVTVLAVLSQFGIQTTSLVAVLGAASLAVGLALQGTLSNLAAGVMLLIFRPFRIGHKLQVGANIGTVKQLSLFWTELLTDDQIQVIIPNASVWGQPCAIIASTRLRLLPARRVSALQKTPSCSRCWRKCVPSLQCNRTSWQTRRRRFCWIAAQPKTHSRSWLSFQPPTMRSPTSRVT
jgi:small-conductance mechanosensitive channel